ncbi:chemotaxis protein CheD [Alkalihalophilus lindianensis]|uniref:Probable chemoreceptor glutamine deamidase CheD n=1 Tax=Alkalihalophilus lindianensis TaxID=1630542 RepID=A0ABU3XC42_9BACI|nr:chemotaxis protein CheD [Alkalihalophilus lindianensis]MDV2685451.1 chemotaxis protein CheD [Alkalihalophilus lindianensis]
MSEVIKVGMADLKVATPPDTIRTSGLGSCVGVVIYDELTNVSGMAHVMLPDSSQSKQATLNIAKYADSAIKELIKQLLGQGGRAFSLKAKIAGGAQMFTFQSGSDVMRIGPRNVEAVKLALKQSKIPILAEDVGGKSGRTIEFDPLTKMLHIRTVNQGTAVI